MKKLKLISGLMIICLIMTMIKTIPVLAGGSLTTSMIITNNNNSNEYYSWFELVTKAKELSPKQNDEYKICIIPEENDLTKLSVTVDSKVAEVSKVQDEPAKEDYNIGRFYKTVNVKIIGEPGTRSSMTINWSVKDQYGETRDESQVVEFTIYNKDTKPYDLGNDEIKILGQGYMFPAEPFKFTATRFTEDDDNYKKLLNTMVGKFGKETKAIYYNLELTDSAGNKINKFNDYIKVRMYISYEENMPKEGEYIAFSVADDGTLTPCVTKYEDGYLTFLTNHFSNYVITVVSSESLKEYEPITTEVMTTEEETTTVTSTEAVSDTNTIEASDNDSDDNSNIVAIGAAILGVVILGAVVTIFVKSRKR